jgi:membrane protein YdbS with pleckstrin-like domain
METLNPRVRLQWVVRSLLGALVLGVLLLVAGRFLEMPRLWLAAPAVGLVAVVHALARYRVWGFEVSADALYLERGVLTRIETSVPFVRVQHVDTRRGPVDRLLGLASVVVYTAGSRGADVTVPGLRPERAEQLREQLRDLAIESEGEDAV